jgi:hypothetical protein
LASLYDVRVHQHQRAFGHTNILSGTVLHSSFVGGRWRTLVTIESDKERNVLAFASTHLEPQQRVWLEFPPEYCQIVPSA